MYLCGIFINKFTEFNFNLVELELGSKFEN